MQIALLGKNFVWGGGIDFLRYVANGLLAKQQERDITLYLLLPVDNKIEVFDDVARVLKRSFLGSIQKKQLWLAKPHHAYLDSFLDYFTHVKGDIQFIYYENSTRGLIRCLKKINADVVLPVNGTLGDDFPIPWIGYSADFQHKYYPQNFSARDCLGRDVHFAETYRDAKAVIVNSQAVKDDIYRFFPYIESDIYNLPFSPCPLSGWLEDLPVDVATTYDLPEEYFLISNQFWLHKDHKTAFKAYANFSQRSGFGLVCTGSMADYRSPGYLEELTSLLNIEGIKNSVKLLGHIPKRDQIEIMKKAKALIQPTLFEGGPGGGCVYDAVALGVPVILSDIAVNREVDADNIFYFEAGKAVDLKERMEEVSVKEFKRSPPEDLLTLGIRRTELLGDCLMEAVDSVTRS